MRSFLIPKIALFGLPATVLTCCSVTAGYYWGGYADKNDLEQKAIDALEKANEWGTKYQKSLEDEIETNKKYKSTLNKLTSAKDALKSITQEYASIIRSFEKERAENEKLAGQIAVLKGTIQKVKGCFTERKYTTGTNTNCLRTATKE